MTMNLKVSFLTLLVPLVIGATLLSNVQPAAARGRGFGRAIVVGGRSYVHGDRTDNNGAKVFGIFMIAFGILGAACDKK